MFQPTAPGKVVCGLLLTSILWGLAPAAHADVLGARSLAMGGARTANGAGTAFAPIYNPAAMSSAMTILLPGVGLRYGSNLLGITDLQRIGSSFSGQSGSAAITNLLDTFGGQPTSRIELGVGVPIIGYTGHPFPLQVMGSPVDFGLNLWLNGNGLVALTSTPGILGVFSNSTKIAADVQTLQSAIQTAPGQLQSSVQSATQAISGLNNLDPRNMSSAASILTSAVTALEGIDATIKRTLPPLLSAGASVSTALAPLGTSSQSLNGTMAADGHLTLAMSGKATVLKTALGGMNIDLAVGANLKGFIMPTIAKNFPSVIGQLTGQTNLTEAVPPIAINLKIDTKPLQSAATISTQVTAANQVITGAQTAYNSILNTARSLRDTANTGAQAQAAGDQAGTQAAQLALVNGAPALLTAAQGASTTVAQLNQSFSGLSGLQAQLQTDLSSIRLEAKNYTSVSPIGGGLDLGAMAQIGDEINVGAALENVVVLWPAQEKTTVMQMNSIGGVAPFKVISESSPTAANYNVTEPFAARLGATYKPKKVEGLTVAADVEQVFNGRPFAARVGIEKRFFNVLGLRVGGQLGGIGTMVTGGIGAKAGGFNIDVGAGTDFNRTLQGSANLSLAF
ncbi:MAG: hypothetical protein H7338_16945 [Candidatus Sericytochromatia bacterium]|nr:hypothetical protein [Candidatus Sericytochromatia bacterium]